MGNMSYNDILQEHTNCTLVFGVRWFPLYQQRLALYWIPYPRVGMVTSDIRTNFQNLDVCCCCTASTSPANDLTCHRLRAKVRAIRAQARKYPRGRCTCCDSMASKKRNYLTLVKKIELIKHAQKKPRGQREGFRRTI